MGGCLKGVWVVRVSLLSMPCDLRQAGTYYVGVWNMEGREVRQPCNYTLKLTVEPPGGPLCPLDCSARGSCNATTGQCTCDAGTNPNDGKSCFHGSFLCFPSRLKPVHRAGHAGILVTIRNSCSVALYQANTQTPQCFHFFVIFYLFKHTII